MNCEEEQMPGLHEPAAKHPLSDTTLQRSDFYQLSGLAQDGGTCAKQYTSTTAFGQRAMKGETACEYRAVMPAVHHRCSSRALPLSKSISLNDPMPIFSAD